MPHKTYGYVVPSLLILPLQLCCLVLCTGVSVGTCLSPDYRPNLEPTTQILRDCCRPQSKQQSSPDNNCCLDKPIVIQTDTSVVTLPSMQILVLTPLIPAAIHWDITPYPLLTLYLLSAILSRAPPITTAANCLCPYLKKRLQNRLLSDWHLEAYIASRLLIFQVLKLKYNFISRSYLCSSN